MRFSTSSLLSLVAIGWALGAYAATDPDRSFQLQLPDGVAPWRVVFGTAADDRIEAIASDEENNIVAVGYTGGMLGVENFWPVGNSVGFVRKFDSSGHVLWERLFDTSSIDIVEAVSFAADGRLIVAGRTAGAFPGQANGGQLDLFVAILTTDGEVLNLLQSGDDRPQHPVAISPLSDGGFVVAGYDDVWVVGNAVMDWSNATIARFDVDETGELQERWRIRSQAPYWDMATGAAAAADDSGDVFITRYDGSDPAQGGGLFVDRVSSVDGSIEWHASVSQHPWDFIVGVRVSARNHVYVAGTTYDPSTTDGISLGGADGFVVEFDAATGHKKWGRPYGSTQSEWITSFAIDASGDLLLAGYSEGVVQPDHVATGNDPFALIISSEGSALGAWQGARAAEADDTYAIARGCGDTMVLAGSMTGVDPEATLGRTDAELTIVRFSRFDSIFHDRFDPTM